MFQRKRNRPIDLAPNTATAMNDIAALLLPLLVVLSHAGRQSTAAEFVVIGSGTPRDVSADGRVVMEQWGPWIWTREDGVVTLGTLPGYEDSSARDLSADGTVVVGYNYGQSSYRPFIWTVKSGMSEIPLPQGYDKGEAHAVSGDGSVVAGIAWNERNRSDTTAFRWTKQEGSVLLETLPSYSGSSVSGISDDGSLIVGTVSDAANASRAVSWTKQGVVSDLGTLGGFSSATAASADGSVIVGFSWNPLLSGEWTMFRWTEDEGMVGLGCLCGERSLATDVTANGKVIVGYDWPRRKTDFIPAVWDEAHGMRDLETVLRNEHGLTDFHYAPGHRGRAWAISDDKKTIVGDDFVLDGDDDPTAWVVYLDRPIDSSLQAGDADQDLDFDQLDLVRVQVAGKYLAAQLATWGEGDWNAAPAIRGDGVFNQLDIVAAQQAAVYLTGSYYGQPNDEGNLGGAARLAALAAGGATSDSHVSLIYDAASGSLSVDAPAGMELTSINIDSAAGIFTASPAQNLGGSFDNSTQSNIFKATFGSSFGSISFGAVARPGLSEQFLTNDLTVAGSLAGGGALGDVDLIYVPEPSTVILLVVGLFVLSCIARLRARVGNTTKRSASAG